MVNALAGLEALRQEIQKVIADCRTTIKEDVGGDGLRDEGDHRRRAGEVSDAVATLNKSVGKLRLVEEAISRHTNGTHGICAACGEDINPKRLAVIPWAILCIDCQVAEEGRTQ